MYDTFTCNYFDLSKPSKTLSWEEACKNVKISEI